MGSSRRDRETRPRWEVWLLRKDSAGGRTASRPPVAGAPAPIARDGLPVVSCRPLGKLVLLLPDSSQQTLGPRLASAAGDGGREIRA